jgi:hypothetical protein
VRGERELVLRGDLSGLDQVHFGRGVVVVESDIASVVYVEQEISVCELLIEFGVEVGGLESSDISIPAGGCA